MVELKTIILISFAVGETEGREEREQLLALNQVLARQVLERTRGQSGTQIDI